MERNIYFDHAATTAVKKEVLDEMIPYFTEKYGNPSSFYALGQESKAVIETARNRVSKALNCQSKEIYFTSCGSESDNWAIKGAAFSNRKKGNHIITSSIEHHAVLHTCQYLEKQGFEVTYLPVNKYGEVTVQDVKDAIKDTTILITIMYANNEIGTIQPIAEIGEIAREKKILFHTDAVQAIGVVPIDLANLKVDMLSLSAHKFGGPKGIGALYIRKGIRIETFMHGGAQENAKRSGTENVPAIAGLGKAIEMATENIEEKARKVAELRDYIIDSVLEKVPHCFLNGHRTNRLCGNINFSIEFIESESILLMLNMKGISASSGSACTSGSLDPSHVLLAIGLSHAISNSSLRITIGDENTKEEADYLLSILPEIVSRLRMMSPLYEDFERSNKHVQ